MRVANKRIKAIEAGEENVQPVYFVQLDKSGRNTYTHVTTEDGTRYQNVLHAVYKKHNLPHIPQFAEQGEEELATADLTNGCLKKQVTQHTEFWQCPDKRKDIRKQVYKDLKVQAALLTPRAIRVCTEMPLFGKH